MADEFAKAVTLGSHFCGNEIGIIEWHDFVDRHPRKLHGVVAPLAEVEMQAEAESLSTARPKDRLGDRWPADHHACTGHDAVRMCNGHALIDPVTLPKIIGVHNQ